MSRLRLSPSIVLFTAGFTCLAAAPVLAQSSQPANSDTSGTKTSATTAGSSNTNTTANAIPTGDHAPTGSLVKTSGDWRASELVGATVYNSDGKSIGTINDLLVSSDGSISNAVISVGGFLGIGQKLVEIPFNQIKFVPSKSNPASGSSESTSANNAGTAGTAAAPGVAAPGGATASANNTAPGAPAASGTAAANGNAAAASAPAGAARQAEYSATLPGATQASLKADPGFSFNQQG